MSVPLVLSEGKHLGSIADSQGLSSVKSLPSQRASEHSID